MILENAKAFGLSLDLGLVISVWSDSLGCELSRGFPRGADEREPDLVVAPVLVETDEGCENAGTARVTALTDDGRAFLALLADEIPPTVRTPYN